MALYLSETEVKDILTMNLALDAVEQAHVAHANGRAIDIPRQRTRIPTAALHILQGALLDEAVFGYKAYTTARAGARFFVHLFDAATGAPQAVIEADYLGMMRTGAAAGVATKWLAREDAAVAGMFGAGWQARGQLQALARVRALREVRVFSRNEEKRRAFCAEMSANLGLNVYAVDTPEQTIRGADIVTTITTATTPLFDGALLAPGTHVNGAGSNALIRRELDEKTFQRAACVCVDSRATALREAGDLFPVLEKGRMHEGQLLELGELVAGLRAGRRDAEQITIFESQGMAIQDLAVARRVLALARERGLGREMPY